MHRDVYTYMVTIGLGYFIVFATGQFLADALGGTIPFFDYYHIPFILLFLSAVVLVWLRPKIGYPVSTILGLIAVTVFTPFTFVKGISSPAGFGLFAYVVTIFPLILMAVSYSILQILETRKPARSSSARFLFFKRAIGVLVIGFVIGSLTVGAFAAGTESQLLSSAGTTANITIPIGAATPGSLGYNPLNFNTTVGKTVTWINKDTTIHTVTNTTYGPFDSGNLNPGQSYTHVFAQKGVYNYCTLHSWMKGTVTVNP